MSIPVVQRLSTLDRRPNSAPGKRQSTPVLSEPKVENMSINIQRSSRPPSELRGSLSTALGKRSTNNSTTINRGVPIRTSSLFSETRSITGSVKFPSGQTHTLCTSRPKNPRQSEEFWKQMMDDDAKVSAMHEEMCRAKGIYLKSKTITSESSQTFTAHPLSPMTSARQLAHIPLNAFSPDTPLRSLSLCVNPRRTPRPTDTVPLHANHCVPSVRCPSAPKALYHIESSSATATTTPRATSAATSERKRPTIQTISAVIKGATVTEVVAAVDNTDKATVEGKSDLKSNPLVRSELCGDALSGELPPPPYPSITSLSTSEGMTPLAVASRRMNCRAETVPFIDSNVSADSQSLPSPNRAQRNSPEHELQQPIDEIY